MAATADTVSTTGVEPRNDTRRNTASRPGALASMTQRVIGSSHTSQLAIAPTASAPNTTAAVGRIQRHRALARAIVIGGSTCRSVTISG